LFGCGVLAVLTRHRPPPHLTPHLWWGVVGGGTGWVWSRELGAREERGFGSFTGAAPSEEECCCPREDDEMPRARPAVWVVG